MNWKIPVLTVLFAGLIFTAYTQPSDSLGTGNLADTTSINKLLDQSKKHFSDNPQLSIELAGKAKDAADKIDFFKGKALASKNIGMGYYFQGKYLEALQNWTDALAVYQQINDQTGIANMQNNIAAIYTQQGDDEKGLEYSLKSLAISEKLNDKLRILSALNTVGSIYFNKKATWDKALDYLLRALPLCEEIGDSAALGTISENIGEIYFEKNDLTQAVNYFEKSIKALGKSANSSFAYNGIGKVFLKRDDFTTALSYHNRALAIAEGAQSKPNMVLSLEGIANVYMIQKKYTDALSYYHRAASVAEEINDAPDLKDIYLGLATAYSEIGDYKNAFAFHGRYSNVKDTLYNIATDKKLGSIQFEFDLEKKQNEINSLTKDKALTDLQLKRQKFAKNAFMIGLALVFLIAVLILRNYLIKVKTHKILDKQKREIEGLLLNILPAETAKELQEQGHAFPKFYDSVSVMFTDFQGFTLIADKMSPQELLEELNICFMAFDGIMEKYNLEKIKTIGDSYMCAGGIPTPNDQHLDNMIKAGLEIRNFVNYYNRKRKEAGQEPWHLRIGIHIGPIVAGVVGKKKYAYDIWGSTVNIASRMESNGVPGQVNISSSVYELIKNKYTCTPRGKIHAKNVGDIDMYLVDEANKVLDSEAISGLLNEKEPVVYNTES